MTVRISLPAVHRIMADPSGPFARYLNRVVGPAVVNAARQEVVLGEGDSRGRPHIRDSIRARSRQVRGFVGLVIGTEGVDHAAAHHEGARPHQITGNPLLIFFWKKVGQVVAFPKVNHPGNKANPYLLKGAFRAGLRNVRHR